MDHLGKHSNKRGGGNKIIILSGGGNLWMAWVFHLPDNIENLELLSEEIMVRGCVSMMSSIFEVFYTPLPLEKFRN